MEGLEIVVYLAICALWLWALVEAARAARVGWVVAIVLLPFAFIFWFFSSARKARVRVY